METTENLDDSPEISLYERSKTFPAFTLDEFNDLKFKNDFAPEDSGNYFKPDNAKFKYGVSGLFIMNLQVVPKSMSSIIGKTEYSVTIEVKMVRYVLKCEKDGMGKKEIYRREYEYLPHIKLECESGKIYKSHSDLNPLCNKVLLWEAIEVAGSDKVSISPVMYDVLD